jgi:hypothetical protein
MKNENRQETLAKIVVGAMIFCFFVPSVSFAGRSGAGGGDMGSFDVGKWVVGTAVGAASSIGGQYVSSAISGSNFSFDNAAMNWGNNFVGNFASGQMGRAVGAAGNYYGWDPKATIMVSSVVRGSVMTGTGPDANFASFGVGAVKGLASGAVMAGMANEKGEVSPVAGFLGGMAGDLAGGATAGGSLAGGMSEMVHGIPTGLVGMGVGYATQGIEDRQDRYIAEQSANGLYAIVGTASDPVLGTKATDFAFGVDPETRASIDKHLNGGSRVGPNPLTSTSSNYVVPSVNSGAANTYRSVDR